MRDTWAIVGTRNNNLFAYYMVQSITINTSGGGGWGGGGGGGGGLHRVTIINGYKF